MKTHKGIVVIISIVVLFALLNVSPANAASLQPGRLAIMSIALDQPIVPVGLVVKDGYPVWDVAGSAVGWHNRSASPGQGGNVVLNGHNTTAFRHLQSVAVGDWVRIGAGDQVYYYVVTQKVIVKEKGQSVEDRWKNAAWMLPTETERLTMITCWPYPTDTHRLIVVAVPLEIDLTH